MASTSRPNPGPCSQCKSLSSPSTVKPRALLLMGHMTPVWNRRWSSLWGWVTHWPWPSTCPWRQSARSPATICTRLSSRHCLSGSPMHLRARIWTRWTGFLCSPLMKQEVSTETKESSIDNFILQSVIILKAIYLFMV